MHVYQFPMERTFFRDIVKSAIWTVSSVKCSHSISEMFNNDLEKYWLSDSVPPHWICAQFSRQTYISKLVMYVPSQTDMTYAPLEIVIHIGNDPLNLTEWKTFQTSDFQEWIDFDINVSTIFFKITITKNHSTGQNTRIRFLRLYGAPSSPCIDSSICFRNPEVTKYLSIR